MERTARAEPLRHYRRSWVRKPNGSIRLLEAPKTELKDLQRQILHHVLDHIPAHDAAHGFRPSRSVRTGAAHHQGQAVVIRLDLESFFTNISAGRVYGIFRLAGYPEPVAHTLAGLVVNEGSNVARPEYDRLRAVLHEAATSGPNAANREGHPDFHAHLLGRIAWAGAENEARARKLSAKFAAIDW
jgi:hypothetical protein